MIIRYPATRARPFAWKRGKTRELSQARETCEPASRLLWPVFYLADWETPTHWLGLVIFYEFYELLPGWADEKPSKLNNYFHLPQICAESSSIERMQVWCSHVHVDSKHHAVHCILSSGICATVVCPVYTLHSGCRWPACASHQSG